jgi:hypothetical protein
MDPTTMTLDEIRDWAARRQGWARHQYGEQWWYSLPDGNRPKTTFTHEYPIPPTLDAIAGLMPSGWTWARWGDGTWNAQRCYPATVLPKDADMTILETIDTGNELLDRARLAMLATLAEDRNKEKEQ